MGASRVLTPDCQGRWSRCCWKVICCEKSERLVSIQQGLAGFVDQVSRCNLGGSTRPIT